jgi:penicillin-binding protein 1A
MKWFIRLIAAGVILAATGILGIIAGYFYLAPQIPPIDGIREIRFQVPLRIFSRDGLLIQEFGEKRRIPVSYEDLPKQMVQAFLAAEDDRYFEHHGVDYQGLLAAVFELVSTGERTRGGSTITMQVARNLFLSLERTYERKLKEIILSFRIESELSKEEILELYLNKIFMGHRAYGVGAAAQVYYGKKLEELNLAQIAMIAGLPKAPSAYNPVTNPKRALQRRDYVLARMLKLGFISQADHDTAKASEVSARLQHSRIEVENPYLGEMVRNYMVERFGEEEAYTGGYRVTTTIDSLLQPAADDAVRRALLEYDHRHGYRGAEGKVEPASEEGGGLELPASYTRVGDLLPAVVSEVSGKAFSALLADGSQITVEWSRMNWARPFINRNARGRQPQTAADIVAVGDVVRVREILLPKPDGEADASAPDSAWELAQVPQVEGAMVALDPSNGAIRALVGGYDYYRSKFNRATQARRQPGSGFKAVVYSAALANGYNPASLINDAPVVFDDVSLEGEWRPENYSGKFFGPTRLRVALIKSRNLVSIRLLRSLGVETILAHAARFGFDPADLPHNLSLALGSAVVSPLQMSTAYAVLANGGYRVEPYFIASIAGVDGETIYQAEPLHVCPSCIAALDDRGPLPPHSSAAPRVLSPQNAYLMNSMLRDVVRAGTATRARSLGRNDLAGKTGTTNDQRDAWFNGFHPSLVANVWVGFDSNDKLGRGEVGGRAALPAWIYFMETALADVPDAPLRMPEGIMQVRIDPQTGKRAYPGQPDAIFEVFPADQVPAESAIARDPRPLPQDGESSDSPARPVAVPGSMEIF